MIFLILNGILFFSLFGISLYVERILDKKNIIFLNNLLFLILAVFFRTVLLALVLFTDKIGTIRIVTVLSYSFETAFVLGFINSVVAFPKGTTHIGISVLKFLIFAIITFFMFMNLEIVAFGKDVGLLLSSPVVIEDLGFTWIDLWKSFCFYFLPLAAALYIVIRPDNTKTKLNREKLLYNLVSLAVIMAINPVFDSLETKIAFFNSLHGFGFALALWIYYRSLKLDILFDFEYVINKSLTLLLLKISPGMFCGFIFYLVMPYRESFPLLFIVVIFLTILGVTIIVHLLEKPFRRIESGFSQTFEKEMEKDFVNLDYDASLRKFCRAVDTIFETHLGTPGLTVYLNNGTEFKSIYNSYDRIKTIQTDKNFFNRLLSTNTNIFFRNMVQSDHNLYGIEKEIDEFFAETESEGCILLTEGHRVFGMTLLEQKHLGNEYNSYDHATLEKLYPYIFVAGYYINSIANEKIIDVIKREIRMSDQVIQSIQQNMDLIKNPSIDVGYVMRPARSIGGEFIDFLRLNENRHIFIIGSMSGKGLTASMSMVIMKSIIRTYLDETHDFKQLVEKVNAFIRNNMPRGTFFAGVFGLIDFTDNNLYYINCGIPTLMLYTKAYNNVIEVQGDGYVLGFVDNINKYIKVKKIKINVGDIIFCCTNGLIEARSIRNETFGKSRIQDLIVENLNYSAEKMNQFILEAMQVFISQKQETDVTMLTMKFLKKEL